MTKTNQKLNRWAQERGYRVVTGNPQLIAEVGEVLQRRRDTGEINPFDSPG